MPAMYRAVINVDFVTPLDSNEYEKLKNALVQAGWQWVETSAFAIETPLVGAIWQGIQLVARQEDYVSRLSSLTFHVQGSDDFTGRIPKTAPNHPYALDDIMGRPLPAA